MGCEPSKPEPAPTTKDPKDKESKNVKDAKDTKEVKNPGKVTDPAPAGDKPTGTK